MKYVLAAALLVVCMLPLGGHAQENASAGRQINDLDELLQAVRQQQQQQKARNTQREQQFLRDKQQQQARLAAARSEFDRLQRQNQPLVTRTEQNQAEIEQLQRQLQEVTADMGDLASTFREFAGDFSAVLRESMITAQLPARAEQLQTLAASEGQPAIGDIESLWLLLQEEMTEAGKIARFETSVVLADGSSQPGQVMRVGPFSAFSAGDFLRFVPETGELLVLSRQPATHLRSAASEFLSQSGGVAPITVDPTRGSLLGVLGYSPTLRERVEQGGIIALIIIALGVLGTLVAIWRVIHLGFLYLRIRRQLANLSSPAANNPLGRVLLAADGIGLDREELLQLKLDEAVLAEIPALERGNGIIKLLAATSPLLGLLGTVTGMILTFQTISLFGTGDPKLMAGGISQALVTTVLGLVVAIPLLFSHSVVAYMSRSMIQRLDEQCAGVLARMAEQQEGAQ